MVSYVYHNGKEFAVKEVCCCCCCCCLLVSLCVVDLLHVYISQTCLRDDELQTLSKLSHRNVMEISAVIEGERHERYHGGRACYQLMPRVTGKGVNSILLVVVVTMSLTPSR